MAPVGELDGDGEQGVDGREGELEAFGSAEREGVAAGHDEVAEWVARGGVGDAEAEDAVGVAGPAATAGGFAGDPEAQDVGRRGSELGGDGLGENDGCGEVGERGADDGRAGEGDFAAGVERGGERGGGALAVAEVEGVAAVGEDVGACARRLMSCISMRPNSRS